MGPLEPIAGISLAEYAELCAAMKDCGGDLAVCARIAGERGVDEGRWKQAMDGWNERMANPASAGQVALAYMPLYQAALAKTGEVASASFEDYAGMIVLLNHSRYGLDAMYRHYQIDVQKWSQISTYWVGKLAADPALGGRFGSLTQTLREGIDAGGGPPAPQQGAKPTVGGDDVVRAANAVSALPPVAVGHHCIVEYPDGASYEGRVEDARDGQSLIAFQNGHREWLANARVKRP